MLKKFVLLLGLFLLQFDSYAASTTATAGNESNFLESSLRYFDEQLLYDILPRASCPGDDEISPMDEFADLFTVEQLRQGWVVLHVFAAIYFFILLAIICNDYFLPTVECICEDLHLSKDVAAATFMATATSMPEFFTNTISTLILESDMGLGTIIGSLMFNTLGVAGLAALCIDKPVQLDWWPIARDCFIYIFNTIILLVLAWGGSISFVETCIMMGFLVLYYLITFNNNKFMPAIRVFIEDRMNCCFSTRYDLTEPPENSAKAQLPLKKDPLSGDGLFVVNLPENTSSMSSTANLTHWYGGDSDADDIPDSIYAYPHDSSRFMKGWWIFVFPIRFTLSWLIPHPMKHRRLYPLSFIMCILCIGANAYLIVWMLTAFGVAIHVPTIVMGLTFLAAGSTMPEAVSSLISLRNGENGIGVSNSLGANSLAILLSLGVPWFIKNCIHYGSGEPQQVGTQGIEYNILILIISTVALFVILSFSGYRLTKRVGIALFSVYGVFIVLQILIEMNVFFPRDCSS
ncbi:sodium/potassium/calcium exchanger 3 isoform X2 [Drosophila guanche]|uniref:Blast:Sodium/potassium/calcium exchanger 5 n=1 Tax=Drosophila guanche TaxID=7266 RepID=A0A3B0KSE7_DROGU|nr:sodium/potassium/calcium exchanger 3 isoform X2 [Drosophila guanche]SPP89639.1 blast:Sodium/potassium/calcium exchanger 5 [Drosophila guanche]